MPFGRRVPLLGICSAIRLAEAISTPFFLSTGNRAWGGDI